MDIVVHGTKGGRQIFTPKKLGGLLDVNSDVNKASAIGQETYAIRFVEKNIIFSKYKIIRDVRGDKRTGFLAFSLFLPHNKKLLGEDIISALDKISEEYYDRYIPENDNNLKDVREDWSFLDRISEEYKTKLQSSATEDIENMLSGIKDDAFIYYRSEEELYKYFSAPQQEEYSQFRQILFVKDELKDKPENPLNALRHSENNLTGKIDLQNPRYKLLFNQMAKGGVSIDVKVNGITRMSKSKQITWSKQFCEPIIKRGNWNEISNEYIDVNISAESVTVKEIMPPDETKTITFTIRNWKGNQVTDAKISCKNAGYDKPVNSNNQITFIGEDFGKRWLLSASNDRFYSEERPIDFRKDCPGDTCNIDIFLNKHTLTITAHEGTKDGDLIYNTSISKREFINDEIAKTHKITVSHRDFHSFVFDYCPEKDIDPDLLEIPLLRKKQDIGSDSSVMYTANVGKHGTWNDGSLTDRFIKLSGESYLKHLIKPHNGYKFTGFKELGNTLEAQYDKKGSLLRNAKFIVGSIFGTIVIGFGVWFLFSQSGNDLPSHPDQLQQPTVEHISAYIEGNLLILDTLFSYKSIPDIQQNELLGKLDSAIKKREFINTWNFPEFKRLLYYPAQQKFKIAIEKIDSTRYSAVKSKLSDVSSWNLDQIADTINTFFNAINPTVEDIKEIKNGVKDEKKDESKKGVTQSEKSDQKKDSKSVSTPPNIKNPKDITKELRSGTVTKAELQNWISAGMDKYKMSIDLYLKFWSTVSSGQKEDFDKILKDVNKDAILKNSELKDFLTRICANSEAFQRYNSASGKATCKTIAELKTKVQ
jgi:hypothetical protein